MVCIFKECPLTTFCFVIIVGWPVSVVWLILYGKLPKAEVTSFLLIDLSPKDIYVSVKYWLNPLNHINIWQLPLRPRCRDSYPITVGFKYQTGTWYLTDFKCFNAIPWTVKISINKINTLYVLIQSVSWQLYGHKAVAINRYVDHGGCFIINAIYLDI